MIHFTNKDGADSVLNFSKGSEIKYWYIYTNPGKGSTSYNIKNKCEVWNEISTDNGYIMSAFVNQVYCRNANDYTDAQCIYNKNNGNLSWNMTMNINPLLVVVIIYDPSKDKRIS